MNRTIILKGLLSILICIAPAGLFAAPAMVVGNQDGVYMDWPDTQKLPGSGGSAIVTMDVTMQDDFRIVFIPERYLPEYQAVAQKRLETIRLIVDKNKKSGESYLSMKDLKAKAKNNDEQIEFGGWLKRRDDTVFYKKDGKIDKNNPGQALNPPLSELLIRGDAVVPRIPFSGSLAAPVTRRLTFIIDGQKTGSQALTSNMFYVLENNQVFMQFAYPAWIRNISRFSFTNSNTGFTVNNLRVIPFDVLSPAENGSYSLKNPAWRLFQPGDGSVSFKAFGAKNITCMIESYEVVLFGGADGRTSVIRKGSGGRAIATRADSGHPAPGTELDILITLNKTLKKITVSVGGTVLMTANDASFDQTAREYFFSSGQDPVAYSNIRSLERGSDAEEVALQETAEAARLAEVARQAEAARLAAEAEAARQAAAEAARVAEVARQAEAARVAAEAEAVRVAAVEAARVAEVARQAEAARLAAEALEAQKQQEFVALKARATAVLDASVSSAFVWKDSWRLPAVANGIVRFKVNGAGSIAIALSDRINNEKPAYKASFFGGSGARSELSSFAAGAAEAKVLVAVDKVNPNPGKELEVMLTFNRGARTITAHVNGEKFIEYVDQKYSMSAKYIGIAASAGEVICSDLTFASVDARENFPESYQLENEFSSRIALGLKDGKLEGWCIDEEKDASIKRFDQRSTDANPWVAIPVALDAMGGAIIDIQDISASSDGLLYILDGQGKAYSYNWSTKHFEALSDSPANGALSLEFISVGSKDAIYAVDVDTNTLYRYRNGAWQQNSSVKAKYVSAANDGSVAVVMPTGAAFLKKEGKGSWQEITGELVRRVAVVNKDTVYGIDNAGHLVIMTAGAWAFVPGANNKPAGMVSELAVNATGALLATDSEMNIYSHNIATILEDQSDQVIMPVAVTSQAANLQETLPRANTGIVPPGSAGGAVISSTPEVVVKGVKKAIAKKLAPGRKRLKKVRTGAMRSRRKNGRVLVAKRARLATKKVAVAKSNKKAVSRTGIEKKKQQERILKNKKIVQKKRPISRKNRKAIPVVKTAQNNAAPVNKLPEKNDAGDEEGDDAEDDEADE